MQTVNVRYIVDDVAAAVAFYRDLLGFTLETNPAPGFAILSKDALRLLLNAPGAGGAGQATPDGARPQPGGWNRFQLETEDLISEVSRLKTAGATFRGDIVEGRGGRQVLVQDPSGNLIELFERVAV